MPIVVDDAGVWRAAEGDEARVGISWEAIARVMAHRLEFGESDMTIVELESDDGDWFELTSSESGFDDAMGLIARRLEGFDFDRWADLFGEEEPVLLWSR